MNSISFGKRELMKSSSVYVKPTDELVTGSEANSLALIPPPAVEQPGIPKPSSGFYSSSFINVNLSFLHLSNDSLRVFPFFAANSS
jgi:hypothetical protein